MTNAHTDPVLAARHNPHMIPCRASAPNFRARAAQFGNYTAMCIRVATGTIGTTRTKRSAEWNAYQNARFAAHAARLAILAETKGA